MLTSEQNLIASGKRLRASLEAKNYSFEDGGTTDEGLQRVLLKPAKKSDGIVNGSLFFEPDSGAVTRMEGRLVKSPSFWLRDVDVTWKFAACRRTRRAHRDDLNRPRADVRTIELQNDLRLRLDRRPAGRQQSEGRAREQH